MREASEQQREWVRCTKSGRGKSGSGAAQQPVQSIDGLTPVCDRGSLDSCDCGRSACSELKPVRPSSDTQLTPSRFMQDLLNPDTYTQLSLMRQCSDVHTPALQTHLPDADTNAWDVPLVAT